MPIIAKNTSTFEPCPAGMQQAVCVDIVDKGVIETAYKDEQGVAQWRHKIDVVWQSSETMKNGKPFLVMKRYTLSLNEKATLRKDLESWRGRAFTEAEAEGFDVEKLIGVNANLNVVHNKGTKGGTFANVSAVTPLMKGQEKMTGRDYVRVCDREPEHDDHHDAHEAPDNTPPVDDIPF